MPGNCSGSIEFASTTPDSAPRLIRETDPPAKVAAESVRLAPAGRLGALYDFPEPISTRCR